VPERPVDRWQTGLVRRRLYSTTRADPGARCALGYWIGGGEPSAFGSRATAFGHGGAGTSYSFADPTSGVSFTYLTNYVQPDPWHSARLDRISNLVHAAIA